MKTFILFLTLTLAPVGSLSAKPIVFLDFSWGASPTEVEAKAANRGYHLKSKLAEDGDLELIYTASFLGKESTVTFSFTPLKRKLYTVRAVWEGTDFGPSLQVHFRENRGMPRVEMEAVKLYIWTRKNTEVELRYGEDETVLTYSDLNLWNDYREEREIREARKNEEADE